MPHFLTTKSRALCLFSLIVISSNQPASLVGGWEPPVLDERSFDAGYNRGGGGGGGHVYYNQETRKSPPFEGRYHPDHGYYPWHDHHSHRGYETAPTEIHHDRNGGKTFLLHRIHRLGEEETLIRRNFDVGPGENGPQSLGSHGGKRTNTGMGGKGFHRVRNKPKGNPPRRNYTQNVDFVFPDNPIFMPKNNDCGEGTTYCETDDDYPKEYINELLKKEGNRFEAVFGRDPLLEMNITERVYKDERNLCSSVQHIIFPTRAKNKDEKWQFVINQGNFTQGIGVEVCLNMDKPCSMTDGFPLAYRTFCKQKYVTRRLLSLNGSGGPGMNDFLFPSCCVCVLQFVGHGTRTKPRS